MKKIRAFTILICVCLLLSARAFAIELELDPTPFGQYGSDNAGHHDYSRFAKPVCSYLLKNDQGYLRVEIAYDSQRYMGIKDGVLFVEQYDEEFNYVSGFELEKQLPIFGGFYDDGTYYYIVFGQENPKEDDSVEVIRVVKYSRDWQVLDSVSGYGLNTTIPFDAGSLRMAHSGKYLYIYTCHEMYTYADGKNHQANLYFCLDTEEMRSGYNDSIYESVGYVSHSFNQYILVDENELITLDHGDAYPRSALLNSGLYGETSLIWYDNQEPEVHYNYTGACVGGLEASETHYITAGTSVRQDGTVSVYDGQRNVYITATTKDESMDTTFTWITSYSDDADVSVSNPHLVKVNDSKFLLIWSEYCNLVNSLKYMLIDGTGAPLSEIYTGDGRLSDCKPIVVGNRVIWYTTLRAFDNRWGRWMSTIPSFHSIDLNMMELEHQHRYSYQEKTRPGLENEGEMTGYCLMCNEEAPVLNLPALNPVDYNYRSIYDPTCTQSGRDVYEYTMQDGLVYLYYTYPEKLGHKVEDPEIILPTHEEDGRVSGVCVRCNQEQSAMLSKLTEKNVYELEVIREPDCINDGWGLYSYESETYGLIQTEDVIPNLHHDYVERTVEGTCTQDGKFETVCARCDYVWFSNITQEATGHAFGEWEIETVATQTLPGWEIRVCGICGETEGRETPALAEPTQFLDVPTNAWYAAPVSWAVAKGVTNGIAENLFGPDNNCTRAQVVTFLWRAAGSPEPASSTNPFTDVDASAWYGKAVLWAVEKGITNGMNATEFGTDVTCTRAQVATFLWRAQGEPAPASSSNPFKDVDANAWYGKAVLWAVENGVTNGMGEGAFAPDGTCTRGQIVTFLYRAIA